MMVLSPMVFSSRYRLALCLSAVLCVSSGLLAQEALPAELVAPAANYRSFMRQIVADYNEKTTKLPLLYAKEIQSLAEQLRAGGDLEGFLAADREYKRFEAAMAGERDPFELTPEMPSSALVKKPAQLRVRQDAYLKSFQEANAEREKRVVDCSVRYVAALRVLTTDLTKKNRIADAMAVKREADRIQKAMDDGKLVALAETFATEQPPATPETAEPASGTSGEEAAVAKPMVYGRTDPWTYWRFEGVKNFAQEGMLIGHPDIPDELTGDYDRRRWKGTIQGRCRFERAVVDMFERSWMGKAFLWSVRDPAQLRATIAMESLELSTGKDAGPHARFAILDADSKVLDAINIPLMSRTATLRIAYNADDNFCAINWLQGKETKKIPLPSKGPYYVLLGFCVRNPGEECNTSFAFE
ncbi:MAG: hypothetical protein ACOX5G_09200 [Kiritimatiellia bacterium]|jgi:hypothetical protein